MCRASSPVCMQPSYDHPYDPGSITPGHQGRFILRLAIRGTKQRKDGSAHKSAFILGHRQQNSHRRCCTCTGTHFLWPSIRPCAQPRQGAGQAPTGGGGDFMFLGGGGDFMFLGGGGETFFYVTYQVATVSASKRVLSAGCCS